MSGHTRGPWEITANPIGGKWIPIGAITRLKSPTHDLVAAAMEGKPSSNANARLIAAAPDLYTLLNEFHDALAFSGAHASEYRVLLDRFACVMQQIEKAEGQS